MSDASAFSPDYTASRARFRGSALAAGARIVELPVDRQGPDGEWLTIDAALVGPETADRVLVVSSGLHGVEGYLGAAVQAAFLEDVLPKQALPAGVRLVLLHALNPYGFAWTRRVNEDNVDLNRNFLLLDEAWRGAPARYAEFDGLLNPKGPPSTLDPFLLRVAWHVARSGLPALREAVAGGQYEFPHGLFFGGSGPTHTYRLLDAHLPVWVAGASRVVHVDFHTGLGKWTTYKLLVDHARGSEGGRALADAFGPDVVEPWQADGVSYAIRGGLGTWCKRRIGGHYDVLCAEFGTASNIAVISALRAENQAHLHGSADEPSWKRAKDQLREVFAPSSREWRDAVVGKGLGILDRALTALSAP
jgi:hypothetical protein